MIEERDEYPRQFTHSAVVRDNVRMSLQPSASSSAQQRPLLPRPTNQDTHREPPPKKYFKSRNGKRGNSKLLFTLTLRRLRDV